MADTLFTQLPVAIALTGDEVVPLDQPNAAPPGTFTTKRATASQIAALAASSSVTVDLVTDAAYAISLAQRTHLISFANASPVAVSLPQTGLTQMTAPPSWFVQVENRGAGDVTITPIGGALIDGAADLTLTQDQGVLLAVGPDNNWYSQRGAGLTALTAVTSVGLALPASIFSVSGSPVTTSGTLTGALVQQVANRVLAGPVTGGDATPTFRALVFDDFPALAGLSVVGRAANTSGAPGAITAATDGQVLRRSGTSIGFGALSLSTAAAVTGTLPVGNGGTGVATTTPFAVLCGGTTGTSAFQSIASVGTTGQVLTSNGAAALPTFQSPPVFGQCRLTLSGANLLLSPVNGNKLTINGVNQTVPAPGVSLTPSGLTPTTLYYIYAFMNAGTMTLEASTTTHATDATTGVEIKSGDATRSLVGAAYVVTGPAFANFASQRLVISWFNRRPIFATNNFTVTRTTTSTSYVEINQEIRVYFLAWANTAVETMSSGSAFNSGAGSVTTSVGVDGTVAEDVFSVMSGIGGQPASFAHANTYSEGFHYSTILGKVSGGTGSWYVDTNTAGNRTTLKMVIQG